MYLVFVPKLIIFQNMIHTQYLKNKDLMITNKTEQVVNELPVAAKVIYTEKHFTDIQNLIEKGIVLFVTATPTETNALHQQISSLPSEKGLIKVSKDNATYFIGTFGNFLVAHVESGMGATGTMGSTITVVNAIAALQPKFVLMVGIAFGLNSDKQNIGDVLISNMISPYEIQRISADREEWRGNKPEASNLLRNAFKNLRDWEYALPNGQKANTDLCELLSGEKLIDNTDYRQDLEKMFPNAKGGEMEGFGVYAACQDKNVDWIIVKSICDFADGQKKANKTEKQALAIDTALSICMKAFSEQYIFEGLGVHTYQQEESISPTISANSQKAEIKTLLLQDKIPAALENLDSLDSFSNNYAYIRLKKEYTAGLEGIKLLDWKDRLDVFINTILK